MFKERLSNHNKYKFKEIKQSFYCSHCMKKLTILIPSLVNMCGSCLFQSELVQPNGVMI